MKLLVVSSLFHLPYRVIRCAAAVGAEIHVLGSVGSRGLANSRHCASFTLSHHIIHGGVDEGLAVEINWFARAHGIDMVLPGDAPATRALIANRALIDAPCFPLPDLETFDRLNDKWAFAQLCGTLGIRCPPTQLLQDVGELTAALEGGRLVLPAIAKALNLDGGRSCLVLERADAREQIALIRYRPILVQAFITGEDIGASVYCERGEIKAFIAHSLQRRTYHTFLDDRIRRDLATLMRHLRTDGVFNFDMRLTAGGEIFYLECNPRFFIKISLSMLAGINFVQLGLPGGAPGAAPTVPEGTQVRLPGATARALLRRGRLGKGDIAALRHIFSDPMPYLMERFNLQREQ